jgi:hypothetical protein
VTMESPRGPAPDFGRPPAPETASAPAEPAPTPAPPRNEWTPSPPNDSTRERPLGEP